VAHEPPRWYDRRVRLVFVFLLACSSQPASTPPETQPSGSAPPVADAAVATIDAPPPKPAIAIVEAPMKWSAERERLTLDYRNQHSDPKATDLAIEPRVIVLHYTGGSTAKGTRDYFDHLKMEAGRPELLRAGLVNVSSHYIVDRDGTIYRLQPETRFARHCIGLNHISIGIENVGDGKRFPLTDAQVTANVALVRDLASRVPITHLLGHHEVEKFRAHAYYLELDPKYRNSKPDPGAEFMQRVREQVTDLKLHGL
jgi:N-acetyl-anhydromuramyl-L-alanine amidase AmpD